MSRTLLIDGSNLFLIHLTANPTVDGSGTPVGGVSGFLRSISWIAKILKPEKVVIFFDGKGGSTKRREILSEYKEGRRPPTVVGRLYQFSSQEKADQNRQYQFKILQDLLEYLPVNVIVSNNFETDDGIAYVVKFKKYFDFNDIIITSCDRDFYQLVNKDVLIYNPMSKKLINEKSIIEEFGIHPKNWLFYRSISGDKSDNVDGVKGIGPKTLCKMFNLHDEQLEYSTEDIEILYENCAELQKDKKQKTLLNNLIKLYENKSKIERNWKLMDLKNPLMSNVSEQFITSRIKDFNGTFKKMDLYRMFDKIGIGFDGMAFDYFMNIGENNR